MSTIIVQLNGGLVSDTYIKGTGKVTKCIIVDYDVEGACEDELVHAKEEDGGDQEAFVHTDGPSKLPKGSDVDLMVKAYLKTQK
jgi:hypothetical protein